MYYLHVFILTILQYNNDIENVLIDIILRPANSGSDFSFFQVSKKAAGITIDFVRFLFYMLEFDFICKFYFYCNICVKITKKGA